MLALLFVGCSREPGPANPGQAITIAVRHEGKELTVGNVDLSGQGGGAALDLNGVAKFKHVPFGKYRVMIIPPEPDAIPRETGSAPAAVAPAAVAPVSDIPSKFRSEETTPLEIDVQPTQGDILFQIDLDDVR